MKKPEALTLCDPATERIVNEFPLLDFARNNGGFNVRTCVFVHILMLYTYGDLVTTSIPKLFQLYWTTAAPTVLASDGNVPYYRFDSGTGDLVYRAGDPNPFLALNDPLRLVQTTKLLANSILLKNHIFQTRRQVC